MRREDYASGNQRQRPKDPAIKPGQVWRAVNQHDFGHGLQDYSIRVNYKDPMMNLWHCSYILGTQNVTIVVNGVNSSAHTILLSQEQVEKNFEFQVSTPAPNVNPNQYVNPYNIPTYPGNPNQWAPMQPANPAVWIAPVTNGIHYDMHTHNSGGGNYGSTAGTFANTVGTYSHAEGHSNMAFGIAAQAEGVISWDAISGATIPSQAV